MSISSAPDPAPILVTGATGKQGGATARALLAAGLPVRALVRDPDAAPAREIAARGARLVVGDLNDRASLAPAVEGARGVFSVQMPPFVDGAFDFEAEVAQGVNLVTAARAAGVPQFVHTSASGAGRHREVPGWAEGRWAAMEATLEAKAALQDRVRAAGFPRWTLLKPAFFMENLLPSAGYLFPRGVEGGLVTTLRPTTRLSLVASADIGRAAAAAFVAPDRFHGVELELAGDYRSMTEVAAILSRALGTELAAPEMTEEEAFAAGMPGMGVSHAWLNVAGQPARPEFARELGIPLTGFDEWAGEHLPEARTRGARA
ncbi:NmrA/HSCARG family protein [Streptomyces triticirhizae]|uniref:NmrA/HSCARG family protein n=1 Tax=Streptomyces triticirhizae TaxID=2483353 RepID=A0A3M2M8X9_9ACTN|nr:NmrA/HSCARG family protein [Streptomyces triticirhizae]RMI43608.1 NmrA/HSCARG family protein [Streptomyces triticirhizae]